jgi:hypothetical protein
MIEVTLSEDLEKLRAQTWAYGRQVMAEYHWYENDAFYVYEFAPLLMGLMPKYWTGLSDNSYGCT